MSSPTALQYCLLPNLAQRMLKPKCIHDAEIVSHYSKDYLYLAAVAFINHVGKNSLKLFFNYNYTVQICMDEQFTQSTAMQF